MSLDYFSVFCIVYFSVESHGALGITHFKKAPHWWCWINLILLLTQTDQLSDCDLTSGVVMCCEWAYHNTTSYDCVTKPVVTYSNWLEILARLHWRWWTYQKSRTPSLIDGWSNAKVDGYRKSPKVCSCGVKGTRVGSTNEFPGTPIVHDGSSNTGGFNPSEK